MITTRRLMIVLAAVSLLLGAIAGCKKKTEEELLEELDKRESPKPKQVVLQVGKPITYWVHDSGATGFVKKTQLSVTFDRAFVRKAIPWVWTQRQYEGQKYLIVYARVQNMGPREIGLPSVSNREVKAGNGNIYESELNSFGNIGPRVTQAFGELEQWKPGAGGGLTGGLKQGDSLWWAFSALIPEEATPIELSGTLEDCPGLSTLNFRLKLPRDLTPSAFD
jgi:hypothetical protein